MSRVSRGECVRRGLALLALAVGAGLVLDAWRERPVFFTRLEGEPPVAVEVLSR